MTVADYFCITYTVILLQLSISLKFGDWMGFIGFLSLYSSCKYRA